MTVHSHLAMCDPGSAVALSDAVALGGCMKSVDAMNVLAELARRGTVRAYSRPVNGVRIFTIEYDTPANGPWTGEGASLADAFDKLVAHSFVRREAEDAHVDYS